ncbi:MAG: FG-GAP repeat protein [Thermoanaerobaculia bacterium]
MNAIRPSLSAGPDRLRPIQEGRSLLRWTCTVLFVLFSAAAQAAVGPATPHAQLFYESTDYPLHGPTNGQEFSGNAVAAGDFDGDGVDDLAIGIHYDDQPIFALSEVGQVQIRWGAAGSGLPNGFVVKYLWQGGTSSVDDPESGDFFGGALAVGDFDHDGFADLAVGIPGEDLGAISNAGAVEIRYGAANRDQALETRRKLLHEDIAGVPDQAGTDDRFGEVLATGDLDGDGFDELLVGVPSESVGGNGDAGRLFVFYGSNVGIVVDGAQTFDEDTTGINSDSFGNDHFARTVVAGDWNGSGFDDLAIGVDHWGAVARSGGVHIIYSNASGPNAVSDVLLTQDTTGIADQQEEFDWFGSTLGTGDFNGDGFDDVVIGVSYEDLGPEGGEVQNAGAVHVLYGNSSVLLAHTPQYWTKSSTGVPGDPAEDERFGSAFVAADFDGDGFDDLAIGVLGERVSLLTGAGAVTILRGSANDLTATYATSWNLERPGVPGEAEQNDLFGAFLGAGDFNGDGHADLVVAVPLDEVAPFPDNSGSALVLYGCLYCDGFESSDLSEWTPAAP